MKCKRQKQIDDYVRNKLTKDEANEFQKHLKKCQTCLAEANLLGTVKKVLAQMEKEYPEINVVDKVMTKIKKMKGI